MWKVTQVYMNQQATPSGFFPAPDHTICPPEAIRHRGWHLADFCVRFGSGTLGAQARNHRDEPAGLDNSRVGSVLSRVDNMAKSKPFVTGGLVIPKIASGSHTLTPKTLRRQLLASNDFFNVTILELPFSIKCPLDAETTRIIKPQKKEYPIGNVGIGTTSPADPWQFKHEAQVKDF